MRLTLARMGLTFGELAKNTPGGGIRGIVYYRLSPFEQKAFAGAITKGFPNTVRRFAENFWRVVPSFVASYFIFDYYEKLSHKMTRKDPEDYKCDQ